LAHRHQPEVILLDIMMPEMDGYEVCQRLKTDPQTADCAVVFLSALDDLQAKVKGFSLGGADYISKPFQSQEVIARVKTHASVIRLERQLQARNRELQSDQTRILNSISEGIYGLDENGIIEFANPAAAAIVGCPVDELIGRNFFETHFATSAACPDSLPVRATCQQGVA
ncbi:response regulator, partial [Marinobacter sp.]